MNAVDKNRQLILADLIKNPKGRYYPKGMTPRLRAFCRDMQADGLVEVQPKNFGDLITITEAGKLKRYAK